MIERHAPEIDQHMAMLPARILQHDHSFKVCCHANQLTPSHSLHPCYS
jgi:hypothetical protein